MSTDSPRRRVAGAFATDLAAYAAFWVPIILAAAVAIGVFTATVGTVDSSILQGVRGFTRWLLIVAGVMAARNYLPLFVAHGISRRQILAGIWPVLVGLALVLGLATAAAFAVEGFVFDALDWPHVLAGEGDRFLYQRPDQYAVIVPAVAVGDLSYLVAGTLIGATYTRLGGVAGTVLLPLSVAPVLVTELVSGGWPLAEVADPLRWPVAAALALGLAGCGLGAAAATAALREVQLDNDNVAWWR